MTVAVTPPPSPALADAGDAAIGLDLDQQPAAPRQCTPAALA